MAKEIAASISFAFLFLRQKSPIIVIVSMAGFLFGGPVPNNIPLVPDHRFGLKIKADRSSA